MPYVFFASPAFQHPWPKRAACWSPATPATGISAPTISASIVPKSPLLRRTSGRMPDGISKSPRRSSSHARSWMS